MFTSCAHALTQQEARAIAVGESDARISALSQAITTADNKTAAFIQALVDDAVRIAGDKVLIVKDGAAIDAVTGASTLLPDSAEEVVSNNRMRGELDSAQAVLKLFSKDDKLRGQAKIGRASCRERV